MTQFQRIAALVFTGAVLLTLSATAGECSASGQASISAVAAKSASADTTTPSKLAGNVPIFLAGDIAYTPWYFLSLRLSMNSGELSAKSISSGSATAYLKKTYLISEAAVDLYTDTTRWLRLPWRVRKWVCA